MRRHLYTNAPSKSAASLRQVNRAATEKSGAAPSIQIQTVHPFASCLQPCAMRPRLPGLLFQRRRNAAERRIEARPNACDHGDDGDRDTGGEQAVFDCGSAALVTKKTLRLRPTPICILLLTPTIPNFGSPSLATSPGKLRRGNYLWVKPEIEVLRWVYDRRLLAQRRIWMLEVAKNSIVLVD